MSRRALARALASIEGFDDPDPTLEQYATPPAIAAQLIGLADLEGDLTGGPERDRLVLDVGCGTGILAIGAALRGARALGIDRDRTALTTAAANAARLGVREAVDWVSAAVRALPIATERPVTVLMNPPFGAQTGQEGADRPFLECAAALATVSYSLHNAGSRAFVEAFAAEHGGRLTHAFAVDLEIDRQFAWHDRDRATIDAEAYRIVWDDRDAPDRA